ncbi:DUF1360 domain-containing protein [Gracilibacillus dipsosauri]|uniref:DUF1360 domain-containing protein n=1 Tax=Gracilibacillus dipsosauri TaxID=178340 RepID=A0A317KZR0_9BACI|nr:DUF1360 domain-containing protein [Gracilibacillus dipsosauri]PWU68706.1 hypothetical protein DLJ74_09765 [Gracilibacillus dipsosauri]
MKSIDIDWLTYLILLLASYRLTHLIVFDKITEFIRNPFLKKEIVTDEKGEEHVKKVPTSKFGYLLNCYWCAGIWSAIFITIAFIWIPDFSWPVIFILSIAGGQAILETFVGVGTKLVKWFSER